MENNRRAPVDWDAIKERAAAEGKITAVPQVDPDSVRRRSDQPTEGTIGTRSRPGGGARATGLDTMNPIKWQRSMGRRREELIEANTRRP